jgi:hypothetical protein
VTRPRWSDRLFAHLAPAIVSRWRVRFFSAHPAFAHLETAQPRPPGRHPRTPGISRLGPEHQKQRPIRVPGRPTSPVLHPPAWRLLWRISCRKIPVADGFRVPRRRIVRCRQATRASSRSRDMGDVAFEVRHVPPCPVSDAKRQIPGVWGQDPQRPWKKNHPLFLQNSGSGCILEYVVRSMLRWG